MHVCQDLTLITFVILGKEWVYCHRSATWNIPNPLATRHWFQWDTLESCGLKNSLEQELESVGHNDHLWPFGESPNLLGFLSLMSEMRLRKMIPEISF